MEFGAGTYALGLVAGVLSLLSPCVLPIVPLLIVTAVSVHRYGAAALSAGLILSFTAVGLFVATIGFAIGLDTASFRGLAAALLIAFGLLLLSSAARSRFSAALSPVSAVGEHLLVRLHLTGLPGQFLVGALLGIIWTPCVGPTLGAASILAAQGKNLPQVAGVMLMFGIGAGFPVAFLGNVSRQALNGMRSRILSAGTIGTHALGILLLVLGASILTGTDKKPEAVLVQHTPGWLTDLTVRY